MYEGSRFSTSVLVSYWCFNKFTISIVTGIQIYSLIVVEVRSWNESMWLKSRCQPSCLLSGGSRENMFLKFFLLCLVSRGYQHSLASGFTSFQLLLSSSNLLSLWPSCLPLMKTFVIISGPLGKPSIIFPF